LFTFGWGRFKTLGERFAVARDATTRLLPCDKIAASHQALMVTLRSCSETLIQSIHSQLVTQLKVSSKWLFLRRPTFAVDGSQFAVPRTKQNLAHFAAASRKSKAAYKKQSETIGGQHIPADKRISPIQILRTLCRLVVDVARKGDRKLNIGKDLSLCVAADESNRRSEKNSESYPRKKRKKPIGDPIVKPISNTIRNLAMKHMN